MQDETTDTAPPPETLTPPPDVTPKAKDVAIGAIVLLYDKHHYGPEPLPAIVTKVLPDRNLGLVAFIHHGGTTAYGRVPFVENGAMVPAGQTYATEVKG